MENNFIQMAVSAGHAVTYTICAVFKHIIDYVQLYFINCLWLVGVTLILEGTPQIIVQQCQIAAPRWPNDISSAVDNAIFKIRAQNIECSFGYVACSRCRITNFWKIFHGNFIISWGFCHKSPKKYFFSYFILLVGWCSNRGLMSNKPTHYLLDGDFR